MEHIIEGRAYVLGVLLVCSYCAFHTWFEKRPMAKGGILGLLANTSVYGAILSLAFAADQLWAMFRKRRETRVSGVRSWKEITGFVALYATLFFVAVGFMMPPDDGTYAADWVLNTTWMESVRLLAKNLVCLVPVPFATPTFWNTLAGFDTGMRFAVPVATAVACGIWLVLRVAPRYLGVFALGLAGSWIFSIVKYDGTVRHYGSIMLLFIACLWFATTSMKARGRDFSSGAIIALWGILAANLVAGGMASFYHAKYDFSGSREMAGFIERSGYDRHAIIADMDYATSSVAGYLGRPFFYVTNGKLQTFVRWNRERKDSGPYAALDFADAYVRNSGEEALLLLNYPVDDRSTRLLARTGKAIVEDEVFYLYAYERR